MKSSPCKDCPKKGCGNHANCEQYLEFQEQRKEIRKKNYDEKMIDGYTVGEVIKARKTSRQWKRKG